MCDNQSISNKLFVFFVGFRNQFKLTGGTICVYMCVARPLGVSDSAETKIMDLITVNGRSATPKRFTADSAGSEGGSGGGGRSRLSQSRSSLGSSQSLTSLSRTGPARPSSTGSGGASGAEPYVPQRFVSKAALAMRASASQTSLLNRMHTQPIPDGASYFRNGVKP